MKNVLILCTGNSARSVMAEALINHLGEGRLKAWSAGSQPVGRVNPLALSTLAAMKVEAGEPRSKSWDEFGAPDAPHMDLIITVCDSAAAEVCPVWPGHPINANWAIPDPAAAPPEKIENAFRQAALQLRHRIELLVALETHEMSAERVQAIHDKA